MSYFLAQHRYLRPLCERQPAFPTLLTVKIQFGPPDAFGVPTTCRRTTTKRGVPATVCWNSNDGSSNWEGDLIDVIHAELNLSGVRTEWSGDILRVDVAVASFNAAEQMVGSLNHLLPAFLSLRLGVFVWIREFMVAIGSVNYRFEIAAHRLRVAVATTESNTDGATRSIQDWIVQQRSGMRIVMALHYYRHAQRLADLGSDPQSMAAEVVLNLAKSIEIILSSDRDMLRQRAATLGLDTTFVERWIIPILLFRNEFDVAHVASAPLDGPQRQVLLNFLDRAFVHVGTFLEQVLTQYQSKNFAPDSPSEALNRDKMRLLGRLEEYANNL